MVQVFAAILCTAELASGTGNAASARTTSSSTSEHRTASAFGWFLAGAAVGPGRPRKRPPPLRRHLRRASRHQEGLVSRHPVLRDHARQRALAAPGVRDRLGRILGPGSDQRVPPDAPARTCATSTRRSRRGSSRSTSARRSPTRAPPSRAPGRSSATRAAWPTSLRWKEPWVGVLILIPAVLDAIRFYHPDAEMGGVGIARREDRRRRADCAVARWQRAAATVAAGPSAKVIVPSTTTWPSTRAMPCRMPIRLRSRRTTASMTTTSPGCTGPPVADALDAGEKRRAAAVLRLREDHDRADLRDRFGEDRRRQHRQLAVAVRQVALVQRDVLDPDDPLVGFELGDAIDEQERIAVRQDPLDRRVVERQRQGIHEVASIIGRHPRMPSGSIFYRAQPVSRRCSRRCSIWAARSRRFSISKSCSPRSRS